MKTFLAIDNEEINERIGTVKEIEIVDSENNLNILMDLLQFVITDFLIINSLLDDSGKKLVEIAKIARGKDIKIIMLVDDPEDTRDKLLITNLAAYGVNAFIKISEFSEERLINFLQHYPEEFDFKFVNEVIEKVVEKKVKVVVEKTIARTIKQQVLAFYTTDNNLDKDDVLTQVSKLLDKKFSHKDSNHKILVIDMNTVNPNLDHFFNVKKEILIKDIYMTNELNTGLSAVYNAIQKDIFSADLLEEFAQKVPGYNNLYVLTGLYNLERCEDFEAEHYEILIESAKERFDTVIMNTHPDIFNTATYVALTKATSIIVVCGANYVYADNSTLIMNELIYRQNILKSKFKVIINNVSSTSLQYDTMKTIFDEYEILGYLPYNPMRESCLNSGKAFITSRAAAKDINYYLEIIEKLGYVPKTSVWNKFRNRKKIANEIIEEKDE